MSSATKEPPKEPRPEVGQRPLPRRGRGWVILIAILTLIALGYGIVNLSTKEANENVVHIAGIGEAQQLFGGVPQDGARLGSDDAPVTVQVFSDEQSSLCREGFLATIPALTEEYARPGSVKFLYRHYSNSENEIEYGFYGTEAAAEQGYGWQYAFLFYVNQEEADRFGITEAENRRSGLPESFLGTLAGSVEELDGVEWEEDLDAGREPDSAMTKSLEAQEELGSKLGIRYGLAMVIEGPRGSATLQENPSLKEVEAAIERVA